MVKVRDELLALVECENREVEVISRLPGAVPQPVDVGATLLALNQSLAVLTQTVNNNHQALTDSIGRNHAEVIKKIALLRVDFDAVKQREANVSSLASGG